MLGDDGPTRRLDALLDDLLGDRPVEAADVLSKISRLLGQLEHPSAQGRIVRRFKTITSFTADSAVKAACVMHMSGVPPHRLVHFLSASLPGSLTLTQFELMVRFIFHDDPPVSQQLLYDLTQYTYLEKKLLARRSVELANRLKGSLTSRLLLYLYMLSLRDDLSNENAHLILLILRICFPALKVHGRTQNISTAETRELAEAWKNAQKSARYAEILPAPQAYPSENRSPRESASFFLDKYFSDAELPGARAAEQMRVAGQRLSFVGSASRGGVPRTPRRTAEEPPRGAPRIPRPKRAQPATGVQPSTRAPKTTPRQPTSLAQSTPRGRASLSGPAPRNAAQRAAASVAPVSPAASAIRRIVHGWVLALGPFVLAAALIGTAVLIDLRQPILGAGRAPAAPSSIIAPAQLPATLPQRPQPIASRVVQPGDSLWKIYRSLHSDGTVVGEWKDFLKLIRERNDLFDPNRIYPGNVLSITTEKK
jgi:hypothetical protein